MCRCARRIQERGSFLEGLVAAVRNKEEPEMQYIPNEMRDATGNGCVPPRPTVGDAWLRALDALVCVLTLGKGRVCRAPGRIINWNGELR